MLIDINPNEKFPKVTEELWQYIFARDNELCQRCGKGGEQAHHIKYRSHGGQNYANNLILLCVKCHLYREHNGQGVDSKILLERIIENERRFRETLV